MGTTTKMAIPYPEATGLVKDGWEDMKDIATQVDAKSGLVLLTNATFSSVSSVSLPNNTFTSNFTNYRIIIDNLQIATSNQDMFFRMRTNGTDYTIADYHYQFSRLDGSTNSVSRGTNQTAGLIGSVGTTNKGSIVIDIFNPQVAVQTTLQSFNPCNISIIRFDMAANMVTGTNQFDSLSFYAGANNISGTYSVFGVNK